MEKTKPFIISRQEVFDAYVRVKANKGGSGKDEETLKDFESNLKKNLYRIWNRLSSGSYFPPPVKAVDIPKKDGKTRRLGIPTVSDRIAQMVVKQQLEPVLEPHFMEDSYGYRPGKSAKQAIGVTRERCWKRNWVLEFDIKGLFDNIPHDLLFRALEKHTDNQWILLYVKRWLTAPIVLPDGTQELRTKGTPQGGVISPLLSNLFMHYAFDRWMHENYRWLQWCRYADDGLVHCRTETQALNLKETLANRMKACGLELHPDKTRIIYCKDVKRRRDYENTQFDFLGYTFRSRVCKARDTGIIFINFTPAVSKKSLNAMRDRIRKMYLQNRTELSLEDIGTKWNKIIQGWINYFCTYGKSEMYKLWRYINLKLIKWMMNKYKKYFRRKIAAAKALQIIAKRDASLFAHWSNGMIGSFA